MVLGAVDWVVVVVVIICVRLSCSVIVHVVGFVFGSFGGGRRVEYDAGIDVKFFESILERLHRVKAVRVQCCHGPLRLFHTRTVAGHSSVRSQHARRVRHRQPWFR